MSRLNLGRDDVLLLDKEYIARRICEALDYVYVGISELQVLFCELENGEAKDPKPRRRSWIIRRVIRLLCKLL